MVCVGLVHVILLASIGAAMLRHRGVSVYEQVQGCRYKFVSRIIIGRTTNGCEISVVSS
jgi:hypothetical protein